MYSRKTKAFMASFIIGHLLIFSLTGCEDFSEWDAKHPSTGWPETDRIETDYHTQSFAEWEEEHSSTGWSEPDRIETDYQGPSLADYVNSGVEEAKNNGLYTESDYEPPKVYGQGDSVSEDSEWNDLVGHEDFLAYLANLEYDGKPYVEVKHDGDCFSPAELKMTYAVEEYSDLDELGRVGVAFASLDESLMPAEGEERGDISSVKPTGWIQAKYDGISNGGWLYNRCHLIAWSLAGENANEKNLMTGTRSFNVDGMLPFEMEALGYVDDNPDNHLLYRATPVYDGDGLLAKGLLLEAYSIEDDGELAFCVYIFNVQPGIEIDYNTGKSSEQ